MVPVQKLEVGENFDYDAILFNRHLPNKHNKEMWKLEREIDSMILEVVKSRVDDDDDDDDDNKKDLLRLLLSAAESYGDDDNNLPRDITPNKFIVDNCKNIYFAGHETTAISASWCLMILAAYPSWQERAREEVLQICGTKAPTSDMLRNMKVVQFLTNLHYCIYIYIYISIYRKI